MAQQQLRVLAAALVMTGLAGCATQGGGSAAVSANYQAAEQAYASGRLEEAQRGYEVVLAQEPDNVQARFRLGTLALRRQRPRLAMAQFEEVLRRAPRHAGAHYNLALVHLAAAERHFLYYTAVAPADAEADRLLALLAAIEAFAAAPEPGTAVDEVREVLLER
jgi:tetratricopeptide (TPR) repeat protein